MTGDKIFLDTNIIIYAYDSTAGEKYNKAKKILADLWVSGLGVVSTQVLQEFFVNVTKKIPNPLNRACPNIADFSGINGGQAINDTN